MKKIGLVLAIIASAVALTSCANHGMETTTTTAAPAQTAHVSHHDYKGETK